MTKSKKVALNKSIAGHKRLKWKAGTSLTTEDCE